MSDTSQEKPDSHGFLMMGTQKLFLCHLPMFFMPDHSYQAILEVELGGTDMENYLNARKQNAAKPLIIMNVNPMLLKDVVNSSSFSSAAYFANENGDPEPGVDPFIKSTSVAVKKSVLFEHLNPNSEYPESLTYYLYGTLFDLHLSHLLSKAPNFQQELDVRVSGAALIHQINESSGLIKISIPSLNERSMQPITSDPLTQPEYTMNTEDDTGGNISIGNKFWINNVPLNQMPGMNM